MNKEYIQEIQRIANVSIKKNHPDISVQEWQAKYILEAKEEFDKQHIHKTEGFH